LDQALIGLSRSSTIAMNYIAIRAYSMQATGHFCSYFKDENATALSGALSIHAIMGKALGRKFLPMLRAKLSSTQM
jgi:hypothetical protein